MLTWTSVVRRIMFTSVQRLFVACSLTLAVAASSPALAAAQTSNQCSRGVAPSYSHGFLMLSTQLGNLMGNPVTCEYPDPKGTGDVEQMTRNGLAFWRKCTNTPTFTDGWRHWGLTPGGLVTWTGTSIDPPGITCEGGRPVRTMGTIRVVNSTGGSLTMAVSGPTSDSWTLRSGETADRTLPLGTYQLTAHAWCGTATANASVTATIIDTETYTCT